MTFVPTLEDSDKTEVYALAALESIPQPLKEKLWFCKNTTWAVYDSFWRWFGNKVGLIKRMRMQ